MAKSSALQLYRTTIFPEQLWMAASNHLINECDYEITITRLVKNQIIKYEIRKKN